jgi:hypothetical protein
MIPPPEVVADRILILGVRKPGRPVDQRSGGQQRCEAAHRVVSLATVVSLAK